MAIREDDRALAAAVVRGVAGAAESLFDRVFDRLYRQVCARLDGDHHTAQDIVGETLLAGLRGLPNFRGEATLASWYLRIALRKIADRKRRRAIQIVTRGDGELEALVGQARGGEDAPLDRLADAETRQLVRETLASLPPRHQSVLTWRYLDDTSVGQVAVRLQVTEKAAERRLARARAALATALRHRGIRSA